jgi:cytochrome c peroxidase
MPFFRSFRSRIGPPVRGPRYAGAHTVHKVRGALSGLAGLALLAGVAACGGGAAAADPVLENPGGGGSAGSQGTSGSGHNRHDNIPDFPPIVFAKTNAAQAALGNLLFFDKELSGNRNIACGTCHHGLTAIGDGLSLPVGEGGRGLGVARDTGSGADAIVERVPRNAPHLFNLGAKGFDALFWDGRVSPNADRPSGFDSPAGDDLPTGLTTMLAAQAMFPVTSPVEMAGQEGENPIADAAAAGNLAGPGGVWDLLAQRIRAIPEYVAMFQDAFDDVDDASDITFVHVANAIGQFEARTFKAVNSPFDRYLAGDRDAMSAQQKRGMDIFFNEEGCGFCHSGPLLTDHKFHSIAMPQIGPGKGDGVDGREDFGRERVTGDPADRYRFRTPSLRNVLLTAPYGHAGAFNEIRNQIRHYRDTAASLRNYDPSQAVLPSRPDLDALDFAALAQPAVVEAIAAATQPPPREIEDDEVEDIVAFFGALTDPDSLDLRHIVPPRVPSGLPLAD